MVLNYIFTHTSFVKGQLKCVNLILTLVKCAAGGKFSFLFGILSSLLDKILLFGKILNSANKHDI